MNKCEELTKDLTLYLDSELESKTLEQELDIRKARLRIHTDWKGALPQISKPTLADKEAYINCKTCKDGLELLKSQKDYKYYKELYYIKKAMYLKQMEE